MLKVASLRVTIKGFIILRNISLDIPAGGLRALVGRNGAGKTTTLKSIMGIMPVSGGSINLDGTDLLHVPGHRRAEFGMGYMPEDRRLIGPLTVEDNILMPAWASHLENGAQRLAHIYDKMPEVAAMARRRASTLSGGQQKMVALARAVMSGTKLLLLDEPFEGLSPAMGEKFARAILDMQTDDLAILIAESDTKRLNFVEKMYTIERGEIVEAAASGG
jgi:branched-chain amino acid transport system ATP-binding protein